MKFLKLKDVAVITTGKTPSKNDDSHYAGGTIPFVKPPNLGSSTPITLTSEYIVESSSKLANIIPKDSILVSCIGILGKVGIAGKDLATNQQINSLTFNEELVHYKYGYYCALNLSKKLNEISNSAVVPIVNKSSFSKLEIPVPSLAEQQRIVRILDEADSIRQKRKESINLLDDYLASKFVEMFGDIKAKKSTHQWGNIRPFVHAESGKSSKNVLSETKTEYPIYGGNGINGWAKEPLYNKPVIIAGRVGQQCGVIHLSNGPSWVTDNAIVITIDDTSRLNPIYLADALRHSPLRQTVQHLDLPFINQSIVLDSNIPLPDVKLQNLYAALVEKIENLRNKMLSQSTELDNQFHALMQKAFNGNL